MLNFTLKTQLKSGKNNMCISRYGNHYPKPEFVEWRSRIISEISQQIDAIKTLTEDLSIEILYIPQDKRRRDIPGMIDALFHVFEHMRLVKDDYQFKKVLFETVLPDKKNGIHFTQISIKALENLQYVWYNKEKEIKKSGGNKHE